MNYKCYYEVNILILYFKVLKVLLLENYTTEIRKHWLELSVPRQSCFFDILPKLFKNSFGTKSKGEFLFAYFTPKISIALTDVTWNTQTFHFNILWI